MQKLAMQLSLHMFVLEYTHQCVFVEVHIIVLLWQLLWLLHQRKFMLSIDTGCWAMQ